MLYNGKDNYPEETVMKLSDSFIVKDSNINLELKVKIRNINYCPTLGDYSLFIHMIRQNESRGMSRDEAIKKAIEDCIKMDVLKEFLSKHGSEVHNMLFAEFNREEELKVVKEEGIEEGIEKGIEKVAKEMLRKGAEIDFVTGVTKLSKEKILELRKEVANEKQG